MDTPDNFDDIRPYNDTEVRPVLERLLRDNDFIDTAVRLKLPGLGRVGTALARPMVRKALAAETGHIHTVAGFQAKLEHYMQRMLDKTVTDLTVTGLEHLDRNKPYCFISNHRDIAMDPALMNWVLFQNHFNTLRIAIGDNLLTKPFAGDLMRLNKCFVVNRSATAPREKLKAAKHLARYITQSLQRDGANIWLAQREGRAKDGRDVTNPAIISMLATARDKTRPFGEFIESLNIVPVAISYELDPLDAAKARELHLLRSEGRYLKADDEDVQSIAAGIRGFKGRVHVALGETLGAGLESPEAVAAALDNAIRRQYVLFPSNCIAYHMQTGEIPMATVLAAAQPFASGEYAAERELFEQRLAQCPPHTREVILEIYANPVRAHLRAGAEVDDIRHAGP